MSNKLDPESLHNPYFYYKPGQKDIWSLINETAAQAQQELGKPIVNLGQGFFSYSPPDFAIDAVTEALSKPQFNQYAPARGNPNLIGEVAKLYSKAFGRVVDPSEIQITTGANEGMFSVFFGFLTPGDEAIVFEPFFDQYIPNIEMTGAKVKYVQLKYPQKFNNEVVSGNDWTIDWEGLENAITDKTKLIVLNTPHNPIGKVFTQDELVRLGEIVIKNNLILVSDEVYDNLYFTPDFPRPANLAKLPELAQRTFTVGSAGKSFAATGWRIGYIHGPANLLKYVTAAHTRICFSTPAPLQEAVARGLVEADKIDYFANTRKDYIKKYEIFTKVFDELGLPYTTAQGAYFLLVNLAKLKIPQDYTYPEPIASKTLDFKLAYWLIKEIGVVGIPPTEFLTPDHREGHGLEKTLRFAVCKDDSVLEEAVQRLRKLKDYL
ncbi:PLP-dependent transferase [Suhomyces tanzawaensis NRRL Y-17324]|uniref:PLP-dependent transferase n=1 Tax=Suhomyces tanzawaensis NRRL Y-17324 TaxID=984487 RepID=A0A1E4SJQ8_9ASCO|nr:PLP-dependent transferase [Suhomyces tanzawaensis NRRL Y-17324]ODV79741.1 PLP-dependent transferase [Suhomyces tanzawaensis NRRL Y-17324]